MKPLPLKQRGFKLDEITYLDRKSIQLDRMLLKFFELLRYDRHPIIKGKKKIIDVDSLALTMAGNPDRFPGFADRPEVARDWLRHDLLQMMRQGKTKQEMVVGPRPFHLNAFKLTNPKAAQDYGASTQVWAMLYYADPTLLNRLKSFFGAGLDWARDIYDGSTALDVETMAVLALCDQVKVFTATTPMPPPFEPLCSGQGVVMADDLRRLLAYEGLIPRHVLAGYIRTLIGLHLSLYMLRLLRLLPDWVRRAQSGDAIPTCDVARRTHTSCCDYGYEITVDFTDNRLSPSAQLARQSAAEHLEQVPEYVRSVVLVNRLKDFALSQVSFGKRPAPRSVRDLLAILADPPADMNGFFAARIADVRSDGLDEEAEDPVVLEILALDSLTPLQKYVELVCMQVMPRERAAVIKMLDSIAEKNKPGGILRQSAGAHAARWFAMGGHLLETLLQIAVVERSAGEFRSRTILIDDFMSWMRERYGFTIYAPAYREVPPEEQEAWRSNERAFRERLHQIGFFADLSDAYNSQTLRPCYEVMAGA